MYGIYIVAIAFAGVAFILGLATLIIWAVGKRNIALTENSKKIEELARRITDMEIKHGEMCMFSNKYKQLCEEYKSLTEKCPSTKERSAKATLFIAIAWGAVSIIIALCGAIDVKIAELGYEKFVAKQEVFEQVYEADNELENIKLTEDLVEMNEWLVNAKANKQVYGCFSKYYNLPIEELEPIGKRGE